MPINDPEQRRAYMRDYQRKRREKLNGGKPKRPPKPPKPPRGPGGEPPVPPQIATAPMPDPDDRLPFCTPHDAVPYVAEQLHLTRRNNRANQLARAKTIGFLIQVGIKALEVAQVGERLDALEMAQFGRTYSPNGQPIPQHPGDPQPPEGGG